jgi:predicted DCC family thiol-disulfide oxidoreductase YuxK
MKTFTQDYPLTLMYDGACPVCNLEMDNLKHRNTQGLLAFIDIASPGFDALPYGATLAEMNGLIHAVRPDGSLVIGVEVFRLAYGAVGLGQLTAPTAWPLLRPLIDAAYAIFARNRYGFSRAFMPLLSALRRARAKGRTAGRTASAGANAQGVAVSPLSNQFANPLPSQFALSAARASAKATACRSGQCKLPTDLSISKGEAS